MESNRLYLHPYIRLHFLVCGLAGLILNNQIEWLLYFYFFVIIYLFLISGHIKKHFNLLLFAIFPIYLSFILLYIVILNIDNWNFIHMKVLKLILLTSVIQLSLLIPSEYLITTFKKYGLKGEALITILGAFTVWTDLISRSEKIITARFARGFVKERTIFNKAKQFPFILVPLVVGIIRTAAERADSWDQKNILQLVENSKIEKINYPIGLNLSLAIVSLCWFLLSLIII